MTRDPRRWRLPHLPARTIQFLIARVERLYWRGATYAQAMERVTAPFWS